ncbi:hypothetical protein KJ359_005858 [Pestalotiopsis sp. 9143b]|nr:hypothetical protein KJ359_005858 [Pestalotiopsis sp. 9143b]
MSLRQELDLPLVMEAKDEHTHTVVFLHRFPAETTDDALLSKVLSQKKPGMLLTLQQRFPTVRWVFPHPKLHKAQQDRISHFEGLSAEDIARLSLEDSDVPYITQVILREARLIGSLDKVIVGGQGETAVAAHAAINRFPEIPSAARNNPEEAQTFIRQAFPGDWTQASEFKLAGFVGMHAVNDEGTQDQRTYLLVSKWANKKTIKDNLVLNTPHKFIHGGTKKQDEPGDGARIQHFADFLTSINVPSKAKHTPGPSNPVEAPQIGPRFAKADEPTSDESAAAKKERELAEREKYAALLKKRKRDEAAARERTLKIIEDDKIERQIRRERERRKLFGPEGTAALPDESKADDLSALRAVAHVKDLRHPSKSPERTDPEDDDEGDEDDHENDENDYLPVRKRGNRNRGHRNHGQQYYGQLNHGPKQWHGKGRKLGGNPIENSLDGGPSSTGVENAPVEDKKDTQS